jgi:hypothetical protein
LPRAQVEAPSDFDLPSQAINMPVSDARRELGKRTAEVTATTKRKGDASIFERLRTVGDRWLVLSDSAASAADWKLFPRGSDLHSQGTRVFVNGVLTESVSQYDHFVEVKPDDALKVVRIENLRSPAWLRLISSKLPLSESEIHFSVAIPSGTSVIKIGVSDYRPIEVLDQWLRPAPPRSWAWPRDRLKLRGAQVRANRVR